MKKPLGLVLLVLYSAVAGIAAIPLGCTGAMLGAVAGVEKTLEPLGYLFMFLGLLSIAQAYGLWTLQNWGRFLAQLNSAISILASIFGLMGFQIFGASGFAHLLTLVISGATLYYLGLDEIKQAFEECDDFLPSSERVEPTLNSKDRDILERDY